MSVDGAVRSPLPERPTGAATRSAGEAMATVAPRSATPETRIVLVRHGEAVCNVTDVCGGRTGCRGLTDVGRRQATALRDRLAATGELAGCEAVYTSVLARALETADILLPALGGSGVAVRPRCDLCELHPGEADGLSWSEFVERFGEPDWDEDPGRPIAPGGESWTGFVRRVAGALDDLAAAHRGGLVLVVAHAGVVEASLLAKLPVDRGLEGARLKLRTQHASMTTWEVADGRWRLFAYNDSVVPAEVAEPPLQPA